MSGITKYELALLPAWVSDGLDGVYVSGLELSMEFWMPKEDSTVTSGPTALEFGDRLDNGDSVQVVGIVNPSSSSDSIINEMILCDDAYTLVLGANAVLSAGVAITVAALLQ